MIVSHYSLDDVEKDKVKESLKANVEKLLRSYINLGSFFTDEKGTPVLTTFDHVVNHANNMKNHLENLLGLSNMAKRESK